MSTRQRVYSVVLVSGLAATWIGCQSATESTALTAGSSASDSATSEFALVSLKVPNMT
jgi:hypothetical protein